MLPISCMQELFFTLCVLKVFHFVISSSFTLAFSEIRHDRLLTQRCTQFCNISQSSETWNKTLQCVARNISIGLLYLRALCFVWLIWSTCHSCLESVLVWWSFRKRTWGDFSQLYQDRLSVIVLIEQCQNFKGFLLIRGLSEELLTLCSFL